MNREVILTGIRANNDLTIGNYFGAIKPMVDMAKNRSGKYQVNFFVPDLHSFTTPIDFLQLKDSIVNNLRVFVAFGLPIDNENVFIYRQSYIPAHSEMTWILDCFTGFGEMARMTQFKDKVNKFLDKSIPGQLDNSQIIEDIRLNATVGLFNYPVLMASDILLYGAKYVPVGEDQTQHLEFTRDIAERINNKFGDIFVVPEPTKKQNEFFGKKQPLRIKDLQDPSKKMSKSDDSGKGVVFLSDNPSESAKKIMSATTDSLSKVAYDPITQPGISNLLEILALLRDCGLDDVLKEFSGQTRYGDFKGVIAGELESFLSDFQDNLKAVDMAAVNSKLNDSELQMNEVASARLLMLQKAIGLR